MGRSVDCLSHAEYVIYFHANWINVEDEEGNFDEIESQLNYDDFYSNLIWEIKDNLKSYSESDKWDGNETKIILENKLAEIGLSEYCGLYSLSIRTKDDDYYNEYNKEGIAKYHCQQIRNTLEKSLINIGGELLNRVGTFSNGCGVFEKTNIS